MEYDGRVHIHRETKGRGGKCVTVITGIRHNPDMLEKIAKDLKRKCGSGGTVKNGVVEIQGDHREKIKLELEKQGYTVTLAGG